MWHKAVKHHQHCHTVECLSNVIISKMISHFSTLLVAGLGISWPICKYIQRTDACRVKKQNKNCRKPVSCSNASSLARYPSNTTCDHSPVVSCLGIMSLIVQHTLFVHACCLCGAVRDSIYICVQYASQVRILSVTRAAGDSCQTELVPMLTVGSNKAI